MDDKGFEYPARVRFAWGFWWARAVRWSATLSARDAFDPVFEAGQRAGHDDSVGVPEAWRKYRQSVLATTSRGAAKGR